MPSNPYDALRRGFGPIPLPVLRACATHFQLSVNDDSGLVEANCKEVARRGMLEVFTDLLNDNPGARKELRRCCRQPIPELQKEMLARPWKAMQERNRCELAVLAKVVDIQDHTPFAIYEQILINGLDSFLDDLHVHKKFRPIAEAFAVPHNAVDGVEQIVDKIFPPRPTPRPSTPEPPVAPAPPTRPPAPSTGAPGRSIPACTGAAASTSTAPHAGEPSRRQTAKAAREGASPTETTETANDSPGHDEEDGRA